jgi:hypothetical protein
MNKTMNTETTCALWLRVEKPSHSTGPYAHVILGPDILAEGSHYSRDEHRGLYLRDFCIRDQIGDNSTPADPDYAWAYGFQPCMVEPYECERMTKTFKAIAKSIGRNEERFGPAKTYGAWVARIANAIGADNVNIPYTNGSDNNREPFNIGPAVHMIDNWVLELGKQVRKFAGKEIGEESKAAA